MSITNITGYKFINLTDLDELRLLMLSECVALDLKGTILLSEEGINLNVAGTESAIYQFKLYLKKDERFKEMTFRQSMSQQQIFKRLKIKLKKEIITFRQDHLNANLMQRPPPISPHELKRWLDEDRPLTLLDTRNEYEVRFGTFHSALHLNLNHFSDFPNAITRLPQDKPLVMFCTGGIRCEKAALHLIHLGHQDVYQLDGGILNYFIEVGSAHFSGECFVFDDRVSVNPHLQSLGTKQCLSCQGPIALIEQHKTILQKKMCKTCHALA